MSLKCSLRRAAALVLLLALCLSLCACSLTPPGYPDEKHVPMTLRISTNALAGWYIYTLREEEYIPFDRSRATELREAINRDFDGDVWRAELGENNELELYLTDSQHIEIRDALEKKLEAGKQYLRSKPYVADVDLADDYSSLTLYLDIDACLKDVEENTQSLDGLFIYLYELYSDSGYIWLCHLVSLLTFNSLVINFRLVNASSGYLISEADFGPYGNEPLSLNRFILNRSYYQDYSDVTEIDAEFVGVYTAVFIDGSEKAYARFRAVSGNYFNVDDVFYADAAQLLQAGKLPEPGTLCTLTIDTCGKLSSPLTVNLPSGILIDRVEITSGGAPAD